MLVSPHKQVQQSEGQCEGVPDSSPPFDEDNDELFDSEDDDCSWWSNDDILNSDYDDDLHFFPISTNINPQKSNVSDEQQEGVVSVQYIAPDDTDNNNKILTSNKSKPSVKSWVCEHCNAINNLLHSIDRGFECISCSGRYRPGQLLIESKEEDPALFNPKLYTVWICNICTCSNSIDWDRCSMCSEYKPKTDLEIFHITDPPKSYNRDNNDGGLYINNALLQNKENVIDINNNNNTLYDDAESIKKRKNKINEKKIDEMNEDKKVLYGLQMAAERELRAFGVFEKSKEITNKNDVNKSMECKQFKLFTELQQYKEDKFDDNWKDTKVAQILDGKLGWNGDFKFIQ